MKAFLSICFLIILALSSLGAQELYNAAMGLDGKLVMEKKGDDGVLIQAYCINEGTQERILAFQLRIVKEDNRGNRSANSQSGQFSIQPKEKKLLSSQELNMAPGTMLTGILQFSEESSPLFADTVLFFVPKRIDKKQKSPEGVPNEREDDQRRVSNTPDPSLFNLGGFVLDDTRSRAGRDLYAAFYTKWLAADVQSNEDYTIRFEELPPRRGRSTIIRIYLNDDLLLERFLQPNYEEIEYLADALVPFLQGKVANLSQIQDDLDNEIIGTDIETY